MNQDRLNRTLPLVALVAAAALVVVLAVQKRKLDTEVGDLRARYMQALREPMRGMYMPPFSTSTLDGAPATIGQAPAAGRQVLFVYTTTCPYCLKSLPAWKQIESTLDTLSAAKAQVYGVSLDSIEVTRRYAQRHALPYPTVRFPEEKLVSMYRAGAVPVTMVLDEEGRTIYARVGEISTPVVVDSVIAAVKWKPEPRPAQPGQPAAGAGR